ncbi:MAG: response regulator [Desulfobacterales bacterium]|nr:response regulator [Desulfobacterales bacterium]MBF0395807.1 response regulator [Desulfobacterales bacterium]
MSIITIFSSEFCQKDGIVQKTLDKTGYKLIKDTDIAACASNLSGISENKIKNAFISKTSIFNKFTHEKERYISIIRLALSEIISSSDNLFIEGFSSQLIPKEITHVLKICLISDMKNRISFARESLGLSEKDAINLIHKHDEDRASWVNMLFKIRDPWDPSLYDIVIPTDKTNIDDIVELIESNLRSEVIKPTDTSKKAALDFILASKVEVALSKEGHNVSASARDGIVTITINKNVLLLNRLEEELKLIALKIHGVKSVETRVGKGFHQSDIYRKYDFEVPKVLLVDDEREFVQTLSERLLIRDMGSAIAYDGESALNMINEEEPEVMILDLKMPGIDGIEVLRRVKQTRPEIEVIILTGHGSEDDRKVCMNLGAFAYLHKPVNIDVLSDTLKKAKDKMKQNHKIKNG